MQLLKERIFVISFVFQLFFVENPRPLRYDDL